jgi:hypothetical protein
MNYVTRILLIGRLIVLEPTTSMKKALFTLALLMFLASFAFGQQEATGDPTGRYGTVTGGQYDEIDLATLGVTVRVPIMSKTGPIPTNAYDVYHAS